MRERKLSLTHCRTKRLGATRTGSDAFRDESRYSGLIHVLNCWALSSFSKYPRQESQKVSIAGMVVSACWGKKGKFESGVTGILDRSDTLIHRGGKKYRLTSTCLKSCNAEFLFISPRGNHHETHLSTIRYAEKANPWFPGTHEDRRWGGRYPGSPRQGTGSPRSIAFKTTAIQVRGSLFAFRKLTDCTIRKNSPRLSDSDAPPVANYFRFSLNPMVSCKLD